MHCARQYLILSGQRVALDHIAAYHVSGAGATFPSEVLRTLSGPVATEILTTSGRTLYVDEPPEQIDSLMRLCAMRPGQPFFSVADDLPGAAASPEGR